MKRFITLLMLMAFTVSFAMPKDNLKTQNKSDYEKVIATDFDIPGLAIDFQFVQVSKINWKNVQYKNYDQGHDFYRVQKSGFFSFIKKSGFGKNYYTNKQNYREAENSQIKTLYSTIIKKRTTYKGGMYLRRIQANYRATKTNYYTATRDNYFKRKFGDLSGFKNTRLGYAFNMDWRCLSLINCSQIIKV